MEYILDHDLHIHSYLSQCSKNPEQTAERILEYAKQNNFKTIALTDHVWDETVPNCFGDPGIPRWFLSSYTKQTIPFIYQSLPLPQADGIRFLFGCEAEMDKHYVIGLSDKQLADLDFIVVPTTHMHMVGFSVELDCDTVERRADAYIRRFDALLRKDLPFYKMGIAHLTAGLIASPHPISYLDILDAVSDSTFRDLFSEAASKGLGIELNIELRELKNMENLDRELRPYRIAADAGCKFYFGSDAHHPFTLDGAMERFTLMRDYLNLTEDQKIDFLK